MTSLLAIETGIAVSDAKRLVHANLGLLKISKGTFREKIQFLKDGLILSKTELKNVIPSTLRLFHLTDTKSLEARVKFLEQVFHQDRQAVRSVILRFPSIFQPSRKTLNEKISFLTSEIFREEGRLRSEILQDPSILNIDGVTRVRRRVEALTRAGRDPSSHFIHIMKLKAQEFNDWMKLPQDLATPWKDELENPCLSHVRLSGKETLQFRISFVVETFGGEQEAAGSVLDRVLPVLAKPVQEGLRPLLRYLTDQVFQGDAQLLRSRLVEFPEILLYSLPDLKKRVNAAMDAGQDPSICFDCIARFSRIEFCNWLEAPSTYTSPCYVYTDEDANNGSGSKSQSLASGRWPEACHAVTGLSFDKHLFDDTSRRIALNSPPCVVDSVEDLSRLENHVFATADVVAVDAKFRCPNGVAIVQLSFRPRNGDELKTYVIDLLAVENDEVFRRICRTFFHKLFLYKLVLGFAVRHVVEGIDATLGSNLLLRIEYVLDLQQVWDNDEQPSLATCAQRYFSDVAFSWKESRICSNWDERPIGRDQLEYAALDAVVLLVILAEKAMEEDALSTKKEQRTKPKKETLTTDKLVPHCDNKEQEETASFLASETGLTLADVYSIGQHSGLLKMKNDVVREKMNFLQHDLAFTKFELRTVFPPLAGFFHLTGAESLENRSKFLTKWLLGDLEAARRVILLCPEVLQIPPYSLEQRTSYLTDKVFNDKSKLVSEIVQDPHILRFHYTTVVEPRVEALALAGRDPSSFFGFTMRLTNQEFQDWLMLPQDSDTIWKDRLRIHDWGQIQLTGEESLQFRMDFLVETFGGEEAVLAVLDRVLPILAKPVQEIMKPKVAYLTDKVFKGDKEMLRSKLRAFPKTLFHPLPRLIEKRVDAVVNAGQDPSTCFDCIARLGTTEFDYWLQSQPKHSFPLAFAATDVKNRGGSTTQSLSSGRWPEACRAVEGLSFKSDFSELSTRKIALKSPPVFVDDVEGLGWLEDHVFAAADVVAVDVEFLSHQKAAIFQLSFRPRAGGALETYIVDLMVSDHDEVYRRVCRGILEKLFLCKLVLGFAVKSDLIGIDATLGSNVILRLGHVLDLQRVWRDEAQPSLAACAQRYCSPGAQLSKSSGLGRTWEDRPLGPAQLEYAALDAAVLLVILAEKVRQEEATMTLDEQIDVVDDSWWRNKKFPVTIHGGNETRSTTSCLHRLLVDELGVNASQAQSILSDASRLQNDTECVLQEKIDRVRETARLTNQQLREILTCHPKILYLVDETPREDDT